MSLPQTPVTLTPEEVEALNTKLSDARHNVNNYLSLIIAAVELIHRKPDVAQRMVDTISQQPDKITAELRGFSAEFDRVLGITHD